MVLCRGQNLVFTFKETLTMNLSQQKNYAKGVGKSGNSNSKITNILVPRTPKIF